MKDPIEGELLIVGDGSQGVYRRRKISWRQLGIQASGRTQYLEKSYRNTQPILSLATLFAAGNTEADEDSVRAPWVDPNKCVRVAGSSPVLLQRQSKQAEVERVVRIVGDLLNGLWFGEKIEALKPEQIAILYPRLRQEDRPLIHRLGDQLKTSLQGCPSVWLTENKASRRRLGDPGVKILTMHSSKGLQFKAVILLFADECPAHFPDTDEAEERCLFYVALTRAEDFLAISCSRKTKFIAEIERAGATSSNESP
jgi:superfamily I DNA/RNA helicase